MRLDRFIFQHPRLYTWKTCWLYHAKRVVYRIFGMDPDDAWNQLLAFRKGLLERYCRNRVVLDVGCGRGDFLGELYGQSPSSALFGLDCLREMVQDARRRFPQSRYCVASGTALPFSDKSFDAVSFHWVFHHLDATQQEVLLGEALRVSRGVVFIQDHASLEHFPMSFFCALYWGAVDGGRLYRTMPAWRQFFERLGAEVVAEYPPSFIRTCIFVVRPREKALGRLQSAPGRSARQVCRSEQVPPFQGGGGH